jgi:hypothetical protein
VVEFSSPKKQSELINKALAEIPHLQGLPYKNTELKAWVDKTAAALKAEFGDGSSEFRRFINAPGKAFVVGTETGRQQEYYRQIDCYEETLRSLLGG